MQKLFLRFALSAVAVAVGAGAAVLTTAPAPAVAQFGYCVNDARCNLLNDEEDCRRPVFDTWCEVSMSGDCTTWTTGKCEFPVE